MTLRITSVEGGHAVCECGGSLRERVGFLENDADMFRCPWVWFECPGCKQLSHVLPLTPGVAILVTGMIPR